MPSYFSLVTLAGQAKIADAIAGGDDIVFTHLAVGDGNGNPTTPAASATSLVHEVWRGSVLSAARDPSNPTQVVVSATIPVGAGPFSIREAAIITDDGALFAIANYPETYKPSPGEGVASELVIEFVVVVDTAAAVTLTIAPSSMIPAHLLLRQPFISVDSMTTDSPPASPSLGAMYVVPPSATGVWSGHTHELTQWTGSEWVFVDAPVRTVVGVIDQGLYFRRTPSGWVAFNASETERGLVRLATAADLAARDGTAAVTAALLGKFGLAMPIFPEVSASNRLLTASAAAGQIVLASGQGWVHRGLHAYSADSFSLAARTFATVASKTYHWRWYAPGHTLAPAATYPFGRIMLRDLADPAYNPTALAEHDPAFDTTHDDMLFMRVTTNASNVATLVPLANAAVLEATITGASRSIVWPSGAETSHDYDFTIAWSRTPRAALRAMSPPGNNYDSDYAISPTYLRREAVQIYSWSWHHQPSGAAINMQSPGFTYDLRA